MAVTPSSGADREARARSVTVHEPYPWANGLVPFTGDVSKGVEIKEHAVTAGLDPGVASGDYSDLAGWNATVTVVPCFGINPMNIIVDGTNAGYCR